MPKRFSHGVAIIGGGAAGLMAAIAAAGEGAEVTLLERGERVGRKLLATGNGRCNLTNLGADPSRYHSVGGSEGMALASAVLASAPPAAVLKVFEALGLMWREEEDGRVYPRSGQASAVLDVLRMACARLNVSVRCGQSARFLTRGKKGFSLTLEGGETLRADRVIVAAGGRAAPRLGGDGGGYALLSSLGHRLTPCYPALVQLRCAHPALPSLKGLRVAAEAALLIDGEIARTECGEVLFAGDGLSGIAALGLAREVAPALESGRTVTARLNLLPERDAAVRRALVASRRELFAQEPAGVFATGLLPRRIGEALCVAGGAPAGLPCTRLTDAQIEALAALLADWRFEVTGTRGFDHAQVTAGGADAREFNPATMESRLVPGLYAAGEVLDVDGDCGGFNLHFAWASGMIAGRRAGWI